MMRRKHRNPNELTYLIDKPIEVRYPELKNEVAKRKHDRYVQLTDDDLGQENLLEV